MNRTILASAGAVALALVLSLPTLSSAQDDRVEGPVYGNQLMTEQERLEYRERMRAAQTDEEREQVRAEHVERMQERARDQGVTLPDDRPGMGPGMGSGMGPANGVERGGMMRDEGMPARDGQATGRGDGPGDGMEERYREEHQEQRHERMMEQDEYRRGSGMGGGGGRN
ncbi:hypothetical protein LV475_06690 [Guyparkeria hydrothermalis]|uniref:hypothetical protein n=2 Tax=Guyparkeria TaxID=2035712 RepID=UPI002021213B|nr:hypothetical protein [Guyparkeria hydrothermalis]MCL7751282.1 hypothetical protein [Guyparkeria hydrothermalis]